ncbi:hypothetical protein HYALB_00013357 [Hymenoscyphus albidus]|uniref:Uncharacterized protein n=1 Tax=Hymenoscyphus albidus TaxID=595503 RepID=A0A9N9M0A5_9HELO|nr:hypothetical protein HYALB_00013357 [Hymenoscyphus albidus]
MSPTSMTPPTSPTSMTPPTSPTSMTPPTSPTSMTPPTQSPVTDGPNIELDWPSDSDSSTPPNWGSQIPLDPGLSDISAFLEIESFFGAELSFEGHGPKIQSTGGTQESLLVGSSGLAGDDVVSITAKPLDISAPENPEHHTSVDVESSTATVQTLEEYILSLRQKLEGEFFPTNQKSIEESMDEISSDLGRIEKAGTIPPSIIQDTMIRRLLRKIMKIEMIPRYNELQIKERVSRLLTSWGEPATLSTTQAQSKSAPRQTVIDLTGADGDDKYVTPPGTPKPGLSSSSSLNSDPPISTEANSHPTPNENPNTKKRKRSTGSDNSSKRRQPPRKTTVKQHLADEIHHSSQWLAGMEKSIHDCEADLVAMDEKKAIFLAKIEEVRKEVIRRKNEFIELKNSMVAWGARNEGVSQEWKSR